uniref:Uncharacterized protein n=1 Tax=Oryzias sinensis TaxID=183150 RepID=A0A8C7XJ57_9TELE
MVTCLPPAGHLFATCGSPVGHLWATCGPPVCHLWVTCSSPVGYLQVICGHEGTSHPVVAWQHVGSYKKGGAKVPL